MTVAEITGLLGAAVGLAGLGTTIATAAFLGGKVVNRLGNIEKMQSMILNQEAGCRAARQTEEDRLHARITDLVEKHAHLKGRINGKERSHA